MVSTFPKQNSQTQIIFLEMSGLKNQSSWPDSISITENDFLIKARPLCQTLCQSIKWSRLVLLFGFVMIICIDQLRRTEDKYMVYGLHILMYSPILRDLEGKKKISAICL